MWPPVKLLLLARIHVGKSQPQLAEDVGVSAKTIFNLERGIASYETVTKVVAHFKTLGVTFLAPEGEEGWGIRDSNEVKSFDDLRPKKPRRSYSRKSKAAGSEPSATDES